MVELKELDQLLAWCMEYNVHLQITCVGIQGFSSQGEMNIEEMSDRNWEVFVEHWKMLGKRYAGIPSAYLSFELMNEWRPNGDEDYIDHIAQYFFEAADAIYTADANRVVSSCTAAIHSEDDYKWLEKLASHGLVLGTHPYYPEQICVRDQYMVYPDEPSWPMPWFPSGIESGDEVTIEGELGGGILTIYFEEADWPTQVYVYGNGKLLEELDPSRRPSVHGLRPCIVRSARLGPDSKSPGRLDHPVGHGGLAQCYSLPPPNLFSCRYSGRPSTYLRIVAWKADSH